MINSYDFIHYIHILGINGMKSTNFGPSGGNFGAQIGGISSNNNQLIDKVSITF